MIGSLEALGIAKENYKQTPHFA